MKKNNPILDNYRKTYARKMGCKAVDIHYFYELTAPQQSSARIRFSDVAMDDYVYCVNSGSGLFRHRKMFGNA